MDVFTLLRRCSRWLVLGAILIVFYATAVHAGELKAELDSTVDNRLFDTHFGRYGFAGKATILREGQAIRFVLPAASKAVGQTGLYSLFALAGDFEMSATFEWVDVAAPTSGYGARCGIAVEAKGSRESVSLARAHLPGKSSRYIVTRGLPSESGIKYEDNPPYATQAKKGRLVLRREQTEIVCLVADDGAEALEELCRVPFPKGTVQPVRVYVDQGESPTSLDVRMGQVHIKAEEIATGVVQREAGGMAWWMIVLIVLGIAVFLGLAYRRFSAAKDQS